MVSDISPANVCDKHRLDGVIYESQDTPKKATMTMTDC